MAGWLLVVWVGPCLVLALESDNAVARVLSLVLPAASSSASGAVPASSSYRQQLGYGLSSHHHLGLGGLLTGTDAGSNNASPFTGERSHLPACVLSARPAAHQSPPAPWTRVCVHGRLSAAAGGLLVLELGSGGAGALPLLRRALRCRPHRYRHHCLIIHY